MTGDIEKKTQKDEHGPLQKWWGASLTNTIIIPPQTVIHNKKSLAVGDHALFIVEVHMKDTLPCDAEMIAIAALVVHA